MCPCPIVHARRDLRLFIEGDAPLLLQAPHKLVYLQNHRVSSSVSRGMNIEMARALVRELHRDATFVLTNVQVSTIIFLDEEAEITARPS